LRAQCWPSPWHGRVPSRHDEASSCSFSPLRRWRSVHQDSGPFFRPGSARELSTLIERFVLVNDRLPGANAGRSVLPQGLHCNSTL
jgi:hypothetical protein